MKLGDMKDQLSCQDPKEFKKPLGIISVKNLLAPTTVKSTKTTQNYAISNSGKGKTIKSGITDHAETDAIIDETCKTDQMQKQEDSFSGYLRVKKPIASFS